MKLKMRGKVWEFVRQRAGLGVGNFGNCEAPNLPGKKIVVDHTIKGVHELEVIIHELLHASDWDKAEEAITETADDMAKCLHKLGYRKVS